MDPITLTVVALWLGGISLGMHQNEKLDDAPKTLDVLLGTYETPWGTTWSAYSNAAGGYFAWKRSDKDLPSREFDCWPEIRKHISYCMNNDWVEVFKDEEAINSVGYKRFYTPYRRRAGGI